MITIHTIVALSTILGYLTTLSLIPLVLLRKSRQSVAAVAWIMAIVTMPCLGGFLFVVFGINQVGRRLQDKQLASHLLQRSLPPLEHHHLAAINQLEPVQRQLLRLSHRLCRQPATVNNRVQLLNNPDIAFAEIEAAINSAKDSIHLEYYIWQPDKLGTRLRDLLIRKAEAGVMVRFLYDGFGSYGLSRKFLRPMLSAGIKVATFVPGQTLQERWSINLRSHRKMIIVDGSTGFTGGMNVGDEYLGQSKKFGYWRDTHLKLVGPAVRQLQEVFVLDWKYATGEELHAHEWFPDPPEPGTISVQIVAGGPDDEDSVFHNLFFAAIGAAQTQVTLSTCYFVPTAPLVMALEAAARRGVRTRIMVSGAKVYYATHRAGRSDYDTLLRAGVDIHEYQRGLFHAKTLTIDGQWSLIGTPNFDARSVFLNFEVAAAVHSASVAEQLDAQFDLDILDAKKIHPEQWSRRSTWQRLQENLCRMFSPIL